MKASALLTHVVVLCEWKTSLSSGVANKILAPLAALVCVAFEKALARFRKVKRHATHGNPTRAVLRETSRDAARRELSRMFSRRREDDDEDAAGGGGGDGDGGGGGVGSGGVRSGGGVGDTLIADNDRVLVVLGGSLGAAAINEAVRGAIPALLGQSDDAAGGVDNGVGGGEVWVVWQAGASGFDELRAEVPRHPRLLLTPFIDGMEVVYGAADLAVARAGAITCSELLATATPSVLVPSPNVVRARGIPPPGFITNVVFKSFSSSGA